MVPLSIYLGYHFEYRIWHFSETCAYRYPEAYLGSYQTSMTKYLCKIWANLSKSILKFSKCFFRFTWESAHWSLWRSLVQICNCSHKAFYDRTVFYKTDSSCFFFFIDLSKLFSFMLCDGFVNSAWIWYKET